MNQNKRPINIHEAYHAHVYFAAETKNPAQIIYDEVGTLFDVNLGRFHEKLVGPHPSWSFQIAFEKACFDELIPWLDEHRAGLSVLVHALSGNDMVDHTDYAYWLGDSTPLNLEFLKPKF